MSAGTLVGGVLVCGLMMGAGFLIGRSQQPESPPPKIITKTQTTTLAPPQPATKTVTAKAPLPNSCLSYIDAVSKVVTAGQNLSGLAGELKGEMDALAPQIALGGDMAKFNKGISTLTDLLHQIGTQGINAFEAQRLIASDLEICLRQTK